MKKNFHLLLLVAGSVCMASCNKDDDNPSPKSDAKQILSFVFKAANNKALNEDVTAEINQEDKTIAATVPFGTELTSLTPSIEVSEEATVSPAGAHDFSSEVTYTVTAENGTKATYKVIVNQADPNASDAKQILSFVFKEEDNTALNEDITAEINQDNHTIIANVPASINETTLTPFIEISEKATISYSGPQQCKRESIYTVTAEDGTPASYTFAFNFTATTQKEVLIAIYKSNPCNTLPWDIYTDDIDTWQGVRLNNEGKITVLILFDDDNEVGYGLTNLPEVIGELTSLEKLESHDNLLTGLPGTIGNLTSLKSLVLSANALTSLPDEIRHLTNLEILLLSSTSLTRIPDTMGNLTSLEELILSHNPLLTNIPGTIGNLPSLEFLNLRHNPLLTTIPAAVCELQDKNPPITILKDDGATCEDSEDN
ncbi:leucine-rich repeat domain-containing protein [Abyssalbus ytuae]|uniref:Disease resistance R13L4/SHOC-2-like LRR domain-containing protein n=1 Tax=Abyssalbus ytuae TaxID=2926907 RepID=A0A9E6ZJS6_9FLAO|nr:leucine-rich repeat domain-containing protein [Abyssalbus ytuae]UOB16904.1 hypothetical protein MQE35_14330 [Abyssalbus ytuae]